VVQTPVKDVLFKLARDAGLDVDMMDNTDDLITINAIDQTLPAIVERLNEQTGLRITLEPKRLIVQADKPYWVNYPIDYVNLDRYSQSSVLLANAVGKSSSQTSATVSLGTSGSQVEPASSLQAGSNIAILNRSRNELWQTLDTGVKRILRAIYPVLEADDTTGNASASASSSSQSGGATSTEVGSQNTNTLSTATNLAGLQAGNSLPAPEQPLFTSSAPYSPYPENKSVGNYVSVAREAGFIAVYAPLKGQQEVQKYIDQTMAGGRRQVMIEATVLEVELNDENQSGINWSALVSDGSFGLAQSYSGTSSLSSTAGLTSITGSSINSDWSLGTTLKLLQRYGNSQVLSSPKMVGINNQPTLLKVVKNLVYFTISAIPATYSNGVLVSPATYATVPNTVPVGLVMSVLPSISESNEITLVVRPTISTLTGYEEDPNPIFKDKNLSKPISNKVPVIQEREMESVLKLNDGQIAILGGLIQDTVASEDTGIPGLVAQEGIGYLFGQKNRTKSKSELVIFLKPILVKHPDIENGSLSDKKYLLPKLHSNAPTGAWR
jgi:general secretion pathway protein D